MPDNDNLLFGINLDLSSLDEQIFTANKKLEKAMQNVKIGFEVDTSELDKLRTKIESVNIRPNIQQLPNVNEQPTQQMQKLLKVAGKGQRVPDDVGKDFGDIDKSQDKFKESMESLDKVLPEFTRAVVNSEKGIITYTRAHKSGESELKKFRSGIISTNRGLTQFRSGLGGALRMGYGMGRGGIGGIAQGLGSMMPGMAGMASLGGMMTMGGMAGGAALGLGAYGMYKGYGQMTSEQPDRLKLMSQIGRGQYEGIARPGGDLYETDLGFDINKQLKMATMFAGQMGGGEGLTESMRTGMEMQRFYGVEAGQTAGLAGAAFKMGGDAEDVQSVMVNAIISGMDKSKLTVLIPQTIQASTMLAEQNFAAFGRSTLSEMSELVTRLYTASDANPLMMPERVARLLGSVGERVRGIGMGGGDLAQRAFLYRAFEGRAKEEGERFSYLKFEEQAERGIGVDAKNLDSIIRQAAKEGAGIGGERKDVYADLADLFKGAREGDVESERKYLGFSKIIKQFGDFTHMQVRALTEAMGGKGEFAGKSESEKIIMFQDILDRKAREEFESSPEGKLIISQSKLTGTMSEIGDKLYSIGIVLNATLTGLASVILPLGKAIGLMAHAFMPGDTGKEMLSGIRKAEIGLEKSKLSDVGIPELAKGAGLKGGSGEILEKFHGAKFQEMTPSNQRALLESSGLPEMAKQETGTAKETAMAQVLLDMFMKIVPELKKGVKEGVMEGNQEGGEKPQSVDDMFSFMNKLTGKDAWIGVNEG